jgi:dsDNA-binding SOS-regulon protein
MDNIDEVVEISPDDLTEEQKQNALIFYAKQLTKFRQYNKTHKNEINEKGKQNYRRIKENPELYEAYKNRKRELYREKHPKKLN